MRETKKRVCPVKRANTLDNKMRKWLQDPQKIVKPFIKEGMTVLDLGCGPGFFSLEMARMVGKSGRVIASDLQEGMLQKVKAKIKVTELEKRIILHKNEENKIGISDAIDFVLAFYVFHEVPDQEEIFHEISSLLKPKGQVLIVEPPLHVSKSEFEETIRKAQKAGFIVTQRPKVFLSKAVILKKREL